MLQADKRMDLASLASIPLIVTLGNSMLIPVLPELERQLRVTTLQISMVITTYSVVAIFLIPVAGYLSDRYGRKKIILPSLVITGIGGLIAGLSAWWVKDSYWLILAGRFVQGIGSAGAMPIVIPLVGDMFRKDDDVSQGLGIIETANTFGKVVSPVLGSALAVVIWFLPFLAIPVFCAVAIVLVAFFVHVPKGGQANSTSGDSEISSANAQTLREFVQSIRSIFKHKGRWLWAIFAIGGVCMVVIFGSMFFLSSKLEDDFGIDGIVKGLILAIPLLFLCVTSYVTGKKISDHKRLMKWMAFAGCVTQTGAIAAAALLTNIYMLIAALVIGGIGIGLVLPCLDSLITEGIEKAERGTVTSLYTSVRFIGVAVGPPAVSLLSKVSQSTVFFSICALCLAAACYSLVAIRPKKTGATSESEAVHSTSIHRGRTPI